MTPPALGECATTATIVPPATTTLPTIVRQALDHVRRGETVQWACSWAWAFGSRDQQLAVDDYLAAIAHPLTAHQGLRDARFHELVRELAGK